MTKIKFIMLFVAVCLMGAHTASSAERNVIVNNYRLTASMLASMESYYGVRVPNGRYWYDVMSGLWGREGGPAEGRMNPGHQLGRLRADASGSFTNVIVNGRRIHPSEVAFLRGCFGYVNPGSYWMNFDGISGYVGGPPQFNVARCFSGGGGGGGRRGSLLSGYFLTGVTVIGN